MSEMYFKSVLIADLNKKVTFNKTGYRHHYCRLD